MGIISAPQYSFNKGEITPKLYGRTDLSDIYGNGVKIAKNLEVQPYGPLHRRRGTRYLETVSKDNVKLIPFIFDTEGDAIIIEFTPGRIRFYKNTILLGAPLTLSNPYSASELDTISYEQLGNLVYIAQGNHPPKLLTRISDTNWTFEDVDFDPPATSEQGSNPNASLTPGATSGDSVNFTAGSAVFRMADIGRQIIGNGGKAIIRNLNSDTVAVADIVRNFNNTNTISSGDWRLDLSPVCELEPSGRAAGSIIEIVGHPENPPEIENGDFTNSNQKWQDISNGSGEIDWNSIARSLQLKGGGSGNEAIAEQPVTGYWTGNFTLNFDNNKNVNVKIGTSSGAKDILDKSVSALVSNSVSFSLLRGQDTLYIQFEEPQSETTAIDNVSIDATYDVFRSSDVGNYISIAGGVCLISKIIAHDKAECQVLKTLNGLDRTINFTFDKKEWTAQRGYPKAVTIFQQRLVLANIDEAPNRVWMSESNIFVGMGTGTDDDDAIQVDTSTPAVKWVSPQQDLIVGSSSKEVTISGSQPGVGITPSNVRQSPTSFEGSVIQNPLSINNEILFISAGGKNIRTLSFDFASDGFTGNNLLIFSDHLTEKSQLKEIAKADKVIYGVREDGKMVVGTYDKQQDVIGWCLWETQGEYENVVAIPNKGFQDVYVVVKRYSQGSPFRAIEVIGKQELDRAISGYSDSWIRHHFPISISDITQADPGKVTTSFAHGFSNNDRVTIQDADGMTSLNGDTFIIKNVTSNTFDLYDVKGNKFDTTGLQAYTGNGVVKRLLSKLTGLGHLEGKEVQVKLDGAVSASRTVSNGEIDLEFEAADIVAGLSYETHIRTLSVGGEGIDGAQRRRPDITLRLRDSTSPVVDGNTVPVRSATDPMNQPPPLVNGDLTFGPQGWDDQGEIDIKTSDPLPFKLQAIYGKIQVNRK